MSVTGDEFWDAVSDLNDQVEQESLQHRRDERLALCGKAVHVIESSNGQRKIVYWRCKDPRCDYCNGIRGKSLRDRVQGLIDTGYAIGYLRVHKDVADKVCKSLGRDSYIRIPQENDEDDVFMDVQDPDKANVDDEFMSEHDWTECARKHGSRIMSGNLGKEPSAPKETGRYLVEVQDVIAEPPKAVVNAYQKTCVEVIVWAQPDTMEENRNARNSFMGAFLKNILYNGGKVYQVIHRKVRTNTLKLDFIGLDTHELDDDIPEYKAPPITPEEYPF